MHVVGKNTPRARIREKVTGAARYVDDLAFPGLFHGATVRSTHPYARIEAIHWDTQKAPPDAVCVLPPDIRGPNGVQLLDDTWPVLADRTVRHVGEAVALVAGRTRLEARQAAAAVTVEYKPHTPVLAIDEAERLTPLCSLHVGEGSVDEFLSRADHVITGEYRTGHQEHIYIECQGVIVWFDIDGSLNVVGSLQCPYFVHRSLMHTFGLPPESVRVTPSVVGGAFGGKEDYPSLIALHAALLARACGQPVKMVYDRKEDILSTPKRHPSIVRHRTGVTRAGEILAMDVEVVLDGGAYRTLSPVVLSRALLHATGAYRVPHARIRGRAVRTNTVPSGAFRGFGVPQVMFALERHLDEIARALKLDPLTIRERNALQPGDRLPTGQVLDETTAARDCLAEVAKRTDFRKRWRECEKARAKAPAGAPRRGVGLSLYLHGSGFTGNGERTMDPSVAVRLDAQGRIEVLTASTDMGQGCDTVLAQIAAEAAGVSLEDVVLALPDTAYVPNSGPTVASRTTTVVGNMVMHACEKLRDAVLRYVEETRGVSGVRAEEGLLLSGKERIGAFRDAAREWREAGGEHEIRYHYDPPAWQVFDEESYRGAAYPTYAWGADVVEVEVDPDTFEVRPLHATVVCEVGRAIHPQLCVGQIEGGTLQSIAFGCLEEMKTDGGRFVNDRLSTYMIPTICDSPRIEVHLLEKPWEGGAFGSKGVGELPMNGGAPAVVQAIENATGLAVNELPASPERLFARVRVARGESDDE
jgi:CO/xanthine dehydrogenase Mo-binding subunit